jgi:hypothetical protein
MPELKTQSTLDCTARIKPGRKADPNRPPRQGPKFTKGVQRPHVWMHPDPEVHAKYHPWQMAKAQAVFRQEPWDLSFEDYCNIWQNDWHNRGRTPDSVCLTRRDEDIGWDFENVEIITRAEHFRRGAERRKYATGSARIQAKPGSKV